MSVFVVVCFAHFTDAQSKDVVDIFGHANRLISVDILFYRYSRVLSTRNRKSFVHCRDGGCFLSSLLLCFPHTTLIRKKKTMREDSKKKRSFLCLKSFAIVN
jgi:hypothetical protein